MSPSAFLTVPSSSFLPPLTGCPKSPESPPPSAFFLLPLPAFLFSLPGSGMVVRTPRDKGSTAPWGRRHPGPGTRILAGGCIAAAATGRRGRAAAGRRRRRAVVAPTALPRARPRRQDDGVKRGPRWHFRVAPPEPEAAAAAATAAARHGRLSAEDRILPRQALTPLRTHRDWNRGRASRPGLSWRDSRPALLLATPPPRLPSPFPAGDMARV